MSEYYEQQRQKLIAQIINEAEGEPMANITMDPATLKLNETTKKRQGRPRNNWYQTGLENYWNSIKTKHDTQFRYEQLDLDNPRIVAAIKQAANQGFGIKKQRT